MPQSSSLLGIQLFETPKTHGHTLTAAAPQQATTADVLMPLLSSHLSAPSHHVTFSPTCEIRARFLRRGASFLTFDLIPLAPRDHHHNILATFYTRITLTQKNFAERKNYDFLLFFLSSSILKNSNIC